MRRRLVQAAGAPTDDWVERAFNAVESSVCGFVVHARECHWWGIRPDPSGGWEFVDGEDVAKTHGPQNVKVEERLGSTFTRAAAAETLSSTRESKSAVVVVFRRTDSERIKLLLSGEKQRAHIEHLKKQQVLNTRLTTFTCLT